MPIMNRLTLSTPLTSRRAAEGVGDLVVRYAEHLV
jgi:hypothetical protein